MCSTGASSKDADAVWRQHLRFSMSFSATRSAGLTELLCAWQAKTMRDVRKAMGEGKTPPGAMTSKLPEPLPSAGQAKPARTGAIKPQAVKVEEGKA